MYTILILPSDCLNHSIEVSIMPMKETKMLLWDKCANGYYLNIEVALLDYVINHS